MDKRDSNWNYTGHTYRCTYVAYEIHAQTRNDAEEKSSDGQLLCVSEYREIA